MIKVLIVFPLFIAEPVVNMIQYVSLKLHCNK